FLELGDQGALHATCEEWSVRFPDDPGAWIVLGQARLCNYYRDLSAVEGMQAVHGLERVLALDAGDRKSRMLLAELFYRIGATQRARAHLEVLKGTDDSEVQALRRQVATATARGHDLAGLFRQIEEEGALPNAPPTALRAT